MIPYTDDQKAAMKQVSILSLACPNTNMRRDYGHELKGPCPMCGGNDRFHIKTDENVWMCRVCSPHFSDTIAFLRARDGLTFPQACAVLLGDELPRVEVRKKESEEKEVTSEWMAAAEEIVTDCESALWGESGAKAVKWLEARGLKEETCRKYRLGFNGESREISGLWVERGILIPWTVGRHIIAMRVRLAAGDTKYKSVKDSAPIMFGAPNVASRTTAFQVEGEFDAMLLDQEAGDLAGVFTLGSASTRMNDSRVIARLLHLKRIFLALDGDPTGRAAAEDLLASCGRMKLATVSGGKDITDAWKAGWSLRAWAQYHLQQDEVERPLEAKPTPIHELLRQGRYVVIQSEKLGESVGLRRDETVSIPEKHAGLATYTVDEMASVKDFGLEMLTAIHAVKKTFEGARISV